MRHRVPAVVCGLGFVFLLVCLVATEVLGATLAQSGDAVVSGDTNGRSWTVASAVVSMSVGFGADGSLVVQRLAPSQRGPNFIVDPVADSTFLLDGQPRRLADEAGSGMRFVMATGDAYRSGVVLGLLFSTTGGNPVNITRHYAAFPGSPIIETWMDVERIDGGSSTLAQVESWRLGVPSGVVDWVSGLQAPGEQRGPFTRQHAQLAPGESMTIGAEGRSTEQALPWVTLVANDHTILGGIMWSGTWNLTFDSSNRGLRFAAGLGSTATTLQPGAVFELPHVLFGVVAGDRAQASAAMSGFAVNVLRGGRSFAPHVTYNTWFTFGARIDEPRIRHEMDVAATLGVELFQLDAGWYVGAGEQGRFDFTTGLGSWRVDTSRFPGGLGSLAARAHELGMRFALWVEPEHVDLATVGQGEGPREEWLVTRDGEYTPGSPGQGRNDAQICLAHPDARQWVLEHLTALVAENGVDYLKWDNNIWVNCNREGHGHGADDGNFAHVRALYELLAELRARFPELLVENCAGGGNRIDLGLLQYSDVAWMDDRTSPSAHVRHNLQGLSAMLPPGYLLSYVMDGGVERIEGSDDLALLVRSRMPGVLGLAFDGSRLGAETLAQLSKQIGDYKRLRDLVADGSATLLTDQASIDTPPPWDVVQTTGADGRLALFVFQNDESANEIVLRPSGVSREASYQIETLDGAVVATMTGAELLTTGFTAHGDTDSAAQVFLLTPR